MSDTILIGVLSMPREMREVDAISRVQFDSRVKEACDELKSRADRLAKLDISEEEMRQEFEKRTLMRTNHKAMLERMDDGYRLSPIHERWLAYCDAIRMMQERCK